MLIIDMADERPPFYRRMGAALSFSDQRLAQLFATNLPVWCRGWIIVSILAAAARGIGSSGRASPVHNIMLGVALALPAIALPHILRQFGPDRLKPSHTRPALLGRWQRLSELECRSLDAYGTSGLLIMLLGGLLLNIPVRAFEFVAAMPTPLYQAPSWYLMLYSLMLTDLMLLSTCYAALVGLAIRHVPAFPRLLAATWLLDMMMQFTIRMITNSFAHLPPVVDAQLEALLAGNVKKIAISMAIWLPYLILSPRVNLTFRHRALTRAPQKYGRIY